jgi:hypothetical protein
MPNGWSFNWESMATREREGLQTRCVESLLVVYLSVSLLCLVDARSLLYVHEKGGFSYVKWQLVSYCPELLKFWTYGLK